MRDAQQASIGGPSLGDEPLGPMMEFFVDLVSDLKFENVKLREEFHTHGHEENNR